MTKAFISKNYADLFTASSKAKLDAEDIARKSGFKNIGLPTKSFQNKTLGRAWTVASTIMGKVKMPRNGIFFAQLPVYGFYEHIRSAKERGNKVILLIHDLNNLRQTEAVDLSKLNAADIIIAHTPAMAKWLSENGITTRIEILQIFDYLTDAEPAERKFDGRYKVAFAGNLGKSTFLNKVVPQKYDVRLFGIGSDKLKLHENVKFVGCFPPNELANHLESDFGLVWDGDSVDTCSGIGGEYLRFICPHKLSMTLASGLPVIVWKESAMADFVEKNGVGIAIKSLNELDDILSNLSHEDYSSMRRNVLRISQKLRNGDYLSTILARY